MEQILNFTTPAPDFDPGEVRNKVRAFLRNTLPAGYSAFERARSWTGFDAAFSQALGEAGYIGMTIPKAFGGHGRSALERHVVVEELLAAGAPVAAHWIADRQSAPMILHKGTEAQRTKILPQIVAGACYFCIGMSEPDSGSDLASVRMRAEKMSDGSWQLNGTKLWTTFAHESHYMICLCRTGIPDGRQAGLSQFLVDLTLPGIRISPVRDIAGEHHFNEVSFTDVRLPATALLGDEGEGWAQVMSELSFERSGPERFLSSFALADEAWRLCPQTPAAQAELGRTVASLMVLRRMSWSVAGALDRGERPDLQAAIVKDLGATFEQELPETLRPVVPPALQDDAFRATYARIRQAAPCYSLRGGTREVLRGIIARGLGIR